MKAAQFTQALTKSAFETEQKFFDAEIAQKYKLKPFVKMWAGIGGEEGFVSEFYQDEHDDIVYTADLCEATLFFKLEVVDDKTAIIHQVGYDRKYQRDYSCDIMKVSKFSEHDEEYWHIAFTGFDTFIDAFAAEGFGTKREGISEAIKALYKAGKLDTYDECNYSHYFPELLSFYDAENGLYTLSKENNGKAIGRITL